MMNEKILQEFVNSVNAYDGSQDAQEKLKNYLCYVAENKKLIDQTYPIDELINIASLKMKAFGFSRLNNSFNNEFADDINGIIDDSIKVFHKAKLQDENDDIVLDGMQKAIIDKFQSLENKRIMLSAPTSFGKTFILQEILAINAEEYKNVMIILPTIALLNENAVKYTSYILQGKLNYKLITTNYEELTAERNLLIFTPERALKFIGVHTNFVINFFFFDEVYKIEDKVEIGDNEKDKRAIAFRTCLYLLAKKVKDFYVAGPYINIKNQNDKNKGLLKFLSKYKVSVYQIAFDPTFRISYDAWMGTQITETNLLFDNTISHNIKIENITLPIKVKRIKQFIDDKSLGKTIYYVDYPNRISSLIKDADIIIPKTALGTELSNLIAHLKNRYNMQRDSFSSSNYWTLIKALEAGIGIHHGQMPRYIQNEILRLFLDDTGELNHLFCTSTIIEGINTVARNVVMVSNSRGKGDTKKFAFKNIRGRAGRYYHNFVGRLFYCSKEQKELNEDNEYMNLEFINYADLPLQNTDIDNTETDDLSDKNKTIKTEREAKFDKKLLPDEIYVQNRLFDRLSQEQLLKNIVPTYVNPKEEDIVFDDLFCRVNEVLEKGNSFEELLKKILQIEADFIFDKFLIKAKDEEEKNKIKNKCIYRVYFIAKKYLSSGFVGLFQYQTKNITTDSLPSKTDDSYNEVFKQMRTVVEYEIPKYISLFQSLFYRACQIKGKSLGEMPLEDFVKEFEIGSSSDFGRMLLEKGYPRDAATEIDNKIKKLRKQGVVLETNKQVAQHIKENNDILNKLDAFEKNLLLRMIL